MSTNADTDYGEVNHGFDDQFTHINHVNHTVNLNGDALHEDDTNTNNTSVADNPVVATNGYSPNGKAQTTNENNPPIDEEDQESEAPTGKTPNTNEKPPIDEEDPESGDGVFKSLVPWCVIYGIGSLVSMSLSSYLGSQITVIEKAFGLSSTTSGILMGANDVGFISTILFASHFLKNRHIPRILAGCVLLFGISAFVASVPHFISDEHMATTYVTNISGSNNNNNSNDNYIDDILCIPGRLNSSQGECSHHGSSSDDGSGLSWVIYVIAGSMFLQGVAKAPRNPLGNIYIDNNSPKTKTGFYIGLMTTFTIFGPMLSTTLGGVFNKIPVDLKDTPLTPEDPRWLGAWWLGFVIFGSMAVIVSIPIFFFPASLRKKAVQPAETKAQLAKEEAQSTNKTKTFLQVVMGIPKSILRVLSQPIYITFNLGTMTTIMGAMVLHSFGPKYMQTQFRIPTWKANIILGVEKLFTSCVGTFVGGFISRRLKLDLFGCIKMVTVARSLSCFCQVFMFMLGCDNPEIVGLDTESSIPANMSCYCSDTSYLPVCAGGQTYFSPCHAGCQAETENAYTMCAASTSGDVYTGFCETGCKYLIPYVFMNGLNSLVATLAIAPSYVVYLRSVPKEDRAMGVGLHSFVLSLLVFLPAPIVLGKLYDSMCLVWNSGSSCSAHSGKPGSCAMYDVRDMRLTFVSIDLGFKLVAVLFSVLTAFLVWRKIRNERLETTEIVVDKTTVP